MKSTTGYADLRRGNVVADLARVADGLKTAMEELYGEREPDDPPGLVTRIRNARAGIRSLLDQAEDLGSQDPLVRRLRAAHPRKSAT